MKKEDLDVDPQSMDNRRLSVIARNPSHPMHTHAKSELDRRRMRHEGLSAQKETKGAPKGYHFTRDGKLRKGDAGADGDGGAKLRSDPLDKQRSKIPPLPEKFANAAQQAAVMAKLKKSGKYDAKEEGKVDVKEVLDTPKAMDSYRAKAKYSSDRAANSAAAKMLRNKNGFHSTDTSDELKTMDKRTKGLKMADRNATNKTFKALRKEQVSLNRSSINAINELDKKTLGSYIKKAGPDADVQRAKAQRHSDAGDVAYKDKDMYKHYGKSQRAMDKYKNRVKGINKAVDKLTKEDTTRVAKVSEATIPDGQTVFTKRPEFKLTNNDKDKLAKIRAMLDREKQLKNEALERDGPKRPDIFGPKGSFGKAASASPAIQKYMAKKAAGYQAQNKAMDPGAAKKGYGIGVTDIDKADKKAKAKGTSMMKRMGSRGKMYKAGKMM